MQQFDDWNQFQQSFHRIKRNSGTYSSNLYAGKEQIEDWIARQQLFHIAGTEASLFLRRDRDFYHVFHAASSTEALVSALKGMHVGQAMLAVDLVGTQEALAPWTDAYRLAGFNAHTSLCRMSRSNGPPMPPCAGDDGVEVAVPEDAADIVAFFERLLDRYAEQLPSIAEVERDTAIGRVLLARHRGILCGVLIFDIKGQSAALRYWHLDGHVRGQGMGGRLMRQFLARCAAVARISLWVKANNAASIAIYRYYGFETDSLVDEIMIKVPKEHHEQNS